MKSQLDNMHGADDNAGTSGDELLDPLSYASQLESFYREEDR